MSTSRRGFTIIEVLIVIVVVVALAAAILTVVDPARRIGNANDSRRKNDLAQIARAIELYTADYGTAPSQLASSTIGVGNKYVLCARQSNISCNGETRTCVLLNQEPFIGTYLATLPIDPSKTRGSDTGYYVTRRQNNVMAFGACSTYDTAGVEIQGRVNLPAYVAPTDGEVATCGNGIVEGSEVCDYTGTACSNNASYRSGGYVYNGTTCTSSTYACNTTCSACINQASCTGSCGSGGVYSGGYCWYVAPDDASSCTTVCTNHSSTCVVAAWNDNNLCAIATALGATCSTCSSVASNKAPYYNSTESSCYYRNSGNGACAGTVGISDFIRICACSS